MSPQRPAEAIGSSARTDATRTSRARACARRRPGVRRARPYLRTRSFVFPPDPRRGGISIRVQQPRHGFEFLARAAQVIADQVDAQRAVLTARLVAIIHARAQVRGGVLQLADGLGDFAELGGDAGVVGRAHDSRSLSRHARSLSRHVFSVSGAARCSQSVWLTDWTMSMASMAVWHWQTGRSPSYTLIGNFDPRRQLTTHAPGSRDAAARAPSPLHSQTRIPRRRRWPGRPASPAAWPRAACRCAARSPRNRPRRSWRAQSACSLQPPSIGL